MRVTGVGINANIGVGQSSWTRWTRAMSVVKSSSATLTFTAGTGPNLASTAATSSTGTAGTVALTGTTFRAVQAIRAILPRWWQITTGLILAARIQETGKTPPSRRDL